MRPLGGLHERMPVTSFSALVAGIKHEAEEASRVVEARRALEALDPEGVAASLKRAGEGFDPRALEGLRKLDKERHGLEQVARKLWPPVA